MATPGQGHSTGLARRTGAASCWAWRKTVEPFPWLEGQATPDVRPLRVLSAPPSLSREKVSLASLLRRLRPLAGAVDSTVDCPPERFLLKPWESTSILSAVVEAADHAVRGKPMNKPADLAKAHLRVARPTDDLGALVRFYRDGLGFEVLYEFTDHDGFDGVMLGHQGAAYHLEFTRKAGHQAGRAPTEDNLLVFYLPDPAAWQRAVSRLEGLGHKPVRAF